MAWRAAATSSNPRETLNNGQAVRPESDGPDPPDDYAETWQQYFQFRREDGILEVRMHTSGGPCKWDLELHRVFIPAFAASITIPRTNASSSPAPATASCPPSMRSARTRNGSREPFEHRHGYDVFYADHTKEPFSLLNLEIPVIAAVNGPCIIHAEPALLNDIVICSENTTF